MKDDPLPCHFDPKCPENRRYPACDPDGRGVSRLCMKKVGLEEIPLAKRYIELDRKIQERREKV